MAEIIGAPLHRMEGQTDEAGWRLQVCALQLIVEVKSDGMPGNRPIQPAGLVRGAIAALTCASALLFGVACLGLVGEFAHALGHSDRPLSWVGLLMDDQTPIPVVLPLVIVCCFALDGLLAIREPARRRADKPFGCSGLFLASAATVLLILGAFWAAEGGHLRQHVYKDNFAIYEGQAMVLAGSLLVGIALGILLRWRGRWLGLICLLPPVACLVGFRVLAARAEAAPGIELPSAWPSATRVLIMAGAVLALSGLSAWAERRTSGQWHRSAGMATAGLWMLAGLAGCAVAMPYHHMCMKGQGNSVQRIGTIVSVAVFAVFLVGRLVVHRSRLRSR